MKTMRIIKKYGKKFEIKSHGVYHDLHVQSDVLLLANVFENFRNKCMEFFFFFCLHRD